jgi:pimeloyl-ACP methyl ester carboxylesterase
MEAVLRWTGLEQPAPADVARMADLWTRAQQPGITPEARRQAFRDLYAEYGRLHGQPMSGPALEGFARFVESTFSGGGRMDLTLPEPRGEPSGDYLHVETRGRGPVRLLLISDLGVDGRRLYESFAQRRADAYTMEIVTLPFAGAARPLPWPSTLQRGTHPWLDRIERELVARIDRSPLSGITVVGTAAGGYFAARLALLRPKRIRSVVLVNALVNTPMRASEDPDAPVTYADRINRVKTFPPVPQLFPVAPLPPLAELSRLVSDPASTHPTARNWMAFAVKDPAVSRGWTIDALSSGFFVPSLQFTSELNATDLTDQLGALTIPMLAIGSWHDEGAPAAAVPSISQWEAMKLRYPRIPLTVVAFADTRTYASADAPDAFDDALADFVAGRTVRDKRDHVLPRTAPRAAVSQAIGAAEVAITYSRPEARGRKVWGELVPFGRVWRAGENEATTFTVNRSVAIDGHPLAAGTYTLFVIPGGDDWTLILNRVPRQWGAVDYDRTFDALRVTVHPVDAAEQESLRYTIEPAGADAAIVTLAWAGRAITFRVEVP